MLSVLLLHIFPRSLYVYANREFFRLSSKGHHLCNGAPLLDIWQAACAHQKNAPLSDGEL